MTITVEPVETLPPHAASGATTIAVLHPKGGVGRSTSSWAIGSELALRGYVVRIEDLDQAKHLTNVVQRRGLLVPGLTIGEEGRADIVLLDTAPEADTARGIGYLRQADWAHRLHPSLTMPDSNDSEADEASTRSAVDAARAVIWRLFEDGQLDEDGATDALLAVDVETRRIRARRTGAVRRAGAAHGIRPLLSAIRRRRPG